MTNKEQFISIAKTINRDGITELLNFLDKTDFYTAPASTTFHSDIEGGLCAHSLHVYDNMSKLAKEWCPDMPEDTIKVVALFHDISKIDFYELYSKNKKVYSNGGSKKDELGYFDWVSEKSYKVKDPQYRDYVAGEHGLNSFLILNDYIKLTWAEASAIINHHAGKDNGYVMRDLNEVFNRYPTATLLHLADMLSTYVTENPYQVENE